MASFIDGITGRKLDPSLAKSDGFFFLSEQGNLETERSSGVLYVFPHECQNFKLEQKEVKKPIDSNAKEMFSPKADQSYSDLLKLKKDENTFLQRKLEISMSRISDCDDCSVEFIRQCKALRSLHRYIKNSLLEKAMKFLGDVGDIRNHYLKQSMKLIKNGETIYMNMFMNDIIPELAKGGMKSMTELVPIVFEEECKNETQVKVLLSKHSKNIDGFRSYVDDQLDLWKSIVVGLNDKTKIMNENEKFIKLIDETMTPFIEYQENINVSLERMRKIIQEHTSKITQIEEEQERFSRGIGSLQGMKSSSDLPLISELVNVSYTDKVRDLDNEIILDLSKCIHTKYKLDEQLLDHFTSLLQTKQRLTDILKKKKRFSKVANQAINESLRNLIFFQNLPSVYDQCCGELIRRNRIVDVLKSKLFKVDQFLREEEEKENKERVKFLSQAQDRLGGAWKIPKDLISSIENRLQLPKLELSSLDPGLPSLNILENSTDQDNTTRGWDIIGDEEWEEDPKGKGKGGKRKGGPGGPGGPEEEEDERRRPRRKRVNPMSQTQVGRMSEELESFYDKIETRRRIRNEQPVPDAIAVAMTETMQRVEETEEMKLKKEIEDLKKKLIDSDNHLRKRDELIGEIRSTNLSKIKNLEKALKDQKEIYEAKLVGSERRLTEIKVQSDQRMQQANEKIGRLEKQLMSEKSSMNENFQAEFEKMKKEKQFLQRKLDGRAKQVSLLEGQVSQAELKMKQLREDMESQALDGKSKQKKTDETKRLLEEVLKSNEKLNKDKVKVNKQFEHLEKVFQASKKVCSDLQNDKKELSVKLEAMNRKKNEMVEITQKQSTVIQKQQNTVENLKNTVHQLSLKIKTLETSQQQQQPRIRSSEEEEEEETEGERKDLESISLLQQLMKKYGKKVTQLMKMGFKKDRFLLLSILLKHEGDVRQCVQDLFSLDEKERKFMIHHNRERDSMNKFIAIRQFEINDPVLFSKKKHGWEAFNIYEDVKSMKKPTLLLHSDCALQIEQTKRNATLATGKVIQLREINILQEDPLNYRKGNYSICVITGITKETVF